MENSDYLPMFLAESREHLQELNIAIVRMEERPDHHATLGVVSFETRRAAIAGEAATPRRCG